MDGKTLRRVLDEASKRWVYRPVDAASGETISKEDFEARRREEEAARRASDPRHRAAEEKRWLEQQRGDGVGRAVRARCVAKSTTPRYATGAWSGDGREEKARSGLRCPSGRLPRSEEMRLATLRETRKKNPGRFAFIETARRWRSAKHETALDAARPTVQTTRGRARC